MPSSNNSLNPDNPRASSRFINAAAAVLASASALLRAMARMAFTSLSHPRISYICFTPSTIALRHSIGNFGLLWTVFTIRFRFLAFALSVFVRGAGEAALNENVPAFLDRRRRIQRAAGGTSRRGVRSLLLVTQGHQGIDACSASAGDIAGEQRDGDQQECNDHVGGR